MADARGARPTETSTLGDPDITGLILDEHEEFRRQFVALWDRRPTTDAKAVAAAWQPLADLLEVHASAEEEIFYPVLLKRGSDEAPDETEDAIRDHNEIRDAIRAAAGSDPGSDTWWQAILACRKANDAHLAEIDAELGKVIRDITDVLVLDASGKDLVADDEERRRHGYNLRHGRSPRRLLA